MNSSQTLDSSATRSGRSASIVRGLGLGIASIGHLLPITGVLGRDTLERLYGITIASEGLELMLRHRAVLLGLVGALLLAAIWKPTLRISALVGGIVNTAVFLWLAFSIGNYGPALHRIALADVVLLGSLLAVVGVEIMQRRASRIG